MKKFKFTLIELLVVIAIIGVLLTILLPSLEKAKDATKSVVCMSNLKQIGITLIRYSSTKDGKLPRSGDHWLNEMGSEDFLNSPTGTIQEQAMNNVLYCPAGLSDQKSAHDSNGGWNYINVEEAKRPWESDNGRFSWYGVVGSANNTVISNGWRYHTWNLTSGGTVWPKITWLANLEAGLALHDGSQSLNTFGGNGGRIAARHKNFTRTNSLFYDGHVQSYNRTTLLSTRNNDGDSDGEIIWRGSRGSLI